MKSQKLEKLKIKSIISISRVSPGIYNLLYKDKSTKTVLLSISEQQSIRSHLRWKKSKAQTKSLNEVQDSATPLQMSTPKTALPETPTKVIGAKTWRAVPPLAVPSHLKDPNYGYRWFNRMHGDRVFTKREEGWDVVQDKSGKLVTKTLHEGSPIDCAVVKRELVLMKLHNTLKEQRTAYYKSKIKSLKQLKNESELGSALYGDIEAK